MKLEDHPTVPRIRLNSTPSVPPGKELLDAGWLKQLVLDAGADDVGAISPEGEFNFSACYTHNYREFMGGFGKCFPQ